jgi:hypothetical protein
MGQQDNQQLHDQWRKWGRGPSHYYERFESDKYVEGECCAVCGALPSAPWHPCERRLTTQRKGKVSDG